MQVQDECWKSRNYGPLIERDTFSISCLNGTSCENIGCHSVCAQSALTDWIKAGRTNTSKDNKQTQSFITFPRAPRGARPDNSVSRRSRSVAAAESVRVCLQVLATEPSGLVVGHLGGERGT